MSRRQPPFVRPIPAAVTDATCLILGVTANRLFGDERTSSVAWARTIIVAACVDMGLSHREIRDHAFVGRLTESRVRNLINYAGQIRIHGKTFLGRSLDVWVRLVMDAAVEASMDDHPQIADQDVILRWVDAELARLGR